MYFFFFYLFLAGIMFYSVICPLQNVASHCCKKSWLTLQTPEMSAEVDASNKVTPSPSLCSLWSSLASLLAFTVYVLIKGSEKGGEPLAPIATEAERNESAATLCQLSVIINSLTILSANYAQSVSAFRAISFQAIKLFIHCNCWWGGEKNLPSFHTFA